MANVFSLGLRIVFTKDEVDFVQNLVFYIETAYLVPVKKLTDTKIKWTNTPFLFLCQLI